jgi:hypothetical protein
MIKSKRQNGPIADAMVHLRVPGQPLRRLA